MRMTKKEYFGHSHLLFNHQQRTFFYKKHLVFGIKISIFVQM